jgi:hypothetical protein
MRSLVFDDFQTQSYVAQMHLILTNCEQRVKRYFKLSKIALFARKNQNHVELFYYIVLLVGGKPSTFRF